MPATIGNASKGEKAGWRPLPEKRQALCYKQKKTGINWNAPEETKNQAAFRDRLGGRVTYPRKNPFQNPISVSLSSQALKKFPKKSARSVAEFLHFSESRESAKSSAMPLWEMPAPPSLPPPQPQQYAGHCILECKKAWQRNHGATGPPKLPPCRSPPGIPFKSGRRLCKAGILMRCTSGRPAQKNAPEKLRRTTAGLPRICGKMPLKSLAPVCAV